MKFNIGDRVTWTSQSAGIVKTKTGRVESIVPAGKRPDMKGCGWQRDHESYTVRVNDKGHSRRYWPRVSALSAQAAIGEDQ